MHSDCSRPYSFSDSPVPLHPIPLRLFGAPSHIPFLLFSLCLSEFDQDLLYDLAIDTIHLSLAGIPVGTH